MSDDRGIAGAPHDRYMQFMVLVEVAQAILRLVLLFDAHLHLAKLFEIRLGHARSRELRRQPLDPAQGLKQVNDLPNRQPRHIRAAPWHKLDQPFGGENF